jgi:hypothetical protein
MAILAEDLVTMSETASARISRHAGILSGQLRSLATTLFPPSASKSLRRLHELRACPMGIFGSFLSTDLDRPQRQESGGDGLTLWVRFMSCVGI